MQIYVEIIGYMAGALTTFAGLPQALKTIRTKDTRGISVVKYAMSLGGTILWLVFGICIESIPVILTNLVSGPLTTIVLYYKIKAKIRGPTK